MLLDSNSISLFLRTMLYLCVKKIIIVSQFGTDHVGGVPRVVERIVNILTEEQCDVSILSEKKLTTRWTRLWKTLTFGKLHHFWVALRASRWLFKNNSGAIVISNGYDAFLYHADIVIAHSINAGIKHNLRESWLRKKLSITSLIERIAYVRCKQIIAVSDNVKEDLMLFYALSEEKIEVIENIIDTSVFYPSLKDTTSTKILYSGAIKNAKGLPLLRQLAHEIAEQSHYTFELLCPHAFQEFDSFSHVRVRSVTNDKEIAAHYQSAVGMFFPSKYEGYSMAILEALACGIPVVLSEENAGYVRTLKRKFSVGVYIVDSSKPLLPQIHAIVSLFDSKKRQELISLSVRQNEYSSYKRKICACIFSMMKNNV